MKNAMAQGSKTKLLQDYASKKAIRTQTSTDRIKNSECNYLNECPVYQYFIVSITGYLLKFATF